MATGDTAAIKADTEALEKAFGEIAQKIYSQQQGAQGGAGFNPNAAQGGADGNTYYNADFEDKTDNQ